VVGAFAPGAQLVFDAALIKGKRRLLGSSYGDGFPAVEIPRLIDLHMDGRLKLDQLISRRIGLEEVNDAFEALDRGEVARSVIIF
jgi:S-(hydroxymethyl)glutathione dehydrogenase/alcohol dehydrogenase